MHEYITELYDTVAPYEQLAAVAGPTEKARAQITRQIFERFARLSNDKKVELKVLEIGPGSGYITNVLNDLLDSYPKCRLDLMDFSDGFIKNVKNKNYKIENYYCANITAENIDKEFIGKYDFILFQEVLEHLVNPFAALANINLMLKNDGVLFLTIPNGSYWRNLFAELFRPRELLKIDRFMDTHICEMSTFGVLKLATMTGFNISEIYYYCTKAKLLKSLISPQIGLLLIKREEPSSVWTRLTQKIVNNQTNQ